MSVLLMQIPSLAAHGTTHLVDARRILPFSSDASVSKRLAQYTSCQFGSLSFFHQCPNEGVPQMVHGP